MLKSRRSELTLAGVFVWYILSIGIFMILLLPFIVPQHQLAEFIPECAWQSQFHKPCAFCGMSTAFYAISRGAFVQAHHLNPLSLYIYFTFLLNTLCALITLKRNARLVKNIGTMLHSDNVLS